MLGGVSISSSTRRCLSHLSNHELGLHCLGSKRLVAAKILTDIGDRDVDARNTLCFTFFGDEEIGLFQESEPAFIRCSGTASWHGLLLE